MSEYKWKQFCDPSNAEATVRDLRKFAQVARIKSRTRSKTRLCKMIRNKTEQIDARREREKRATTCSNDSGLEGDEMADLAPHELTSFEQGGKTWCDRAQVWDDWFATSRKNPYTNQQVDGQVVSRIHKRARFNEIMFGREPTSLEVLARRVFAMFVGDLTMFVQMTAAELATLVEAYKSRQMLTPTQAAYILRASVPLSQQKNDLLKTLLNAKHKIADAAAFEQYTGYITTIYNNVLLEMGEAQIEALIRDATNTQFNIFCNALVPAVFEEHVLDGNLEDKTLQLQKVFLTALARDATHDTALFRQLAQDVLVATPEPEELTALQRNRAYFAFFSSMTRDPNDPSVEELNLRLADLSYVHPTSPVEFVAYWYNLFTSDATAIETYDQVYPLVQEMLDVPNIYQDHLTMSEINTCITTLNPSDLMILEPVFGVPAANVKWLLFDKLSSEDLDERRSTIELMLQFLPPSFVQRFFANHYINVQDMDSDTSSTSSSEHSDFDVIEEGSTDSNDQDPQL